MTNSDNPWQEYLEALSKCCDAVKLTAYHTLETAKHTEQAVIQVGLTAYYVSEAVATVTVGRSSE